MSAKELFQGIFVPVFTAMDDSGELNFEPIPKYIDSLVSSGAKGVYLNGTSGEFFNLTLSERSSVAQVWLKHCHQKLRVILNIGASNLKDSQQLLREAESFEVKADAYAIVVPSYLPPVTVSDLVEYLSSITEISPQSKFFYYHIPMFTHCQVNLAEFLESASMKIPNLIGIKYTDSDINLLKQCRSLNQGKFIILVGNDLLYQTGLQLNCDGAILSSANFCPNIYRRMKENSVSKGIESDTVGLDHYHLVRLFQIINQSASHGMMSCLKNIADLCHLGVGQPRLPLKSLSEKKIDKLRESLTEIGFFEWR